MISSSFEIPRLFYGPDLLWLDMPSSQFVLSVSLRSSTVVPNKPNNLQAHHGKGRPLAHVACLSWVVMGLLPVGTWVNGEQSSFLSDSAELVAEEEEKL